MVFSKVSRIISPSHSPAWERIRKCPMKQQTTALAKVSRPILTGIFQRKRLFNVLDRSRNHPVIWVSGPPGSGKTMLITNYIEARGLPCLWYQVDEGDQDPATFFYYLGHAARQASPASENPFPCSRRNTCRGLPLLHCAILKRSTRGFLPLARWCLITARKYRQDLLSLK